MAKIIYYDIFAKEINPMDVLISGTSRGLGKYLAREFCQEGHRVFAILRADRCDHELQAKYGHLYTPIIADLEKDGCVEVIRKTLLLKTDSIDIVINNAGMSSKDYHLSAASAQEMARVFNLNCLGAVRLMHAALDFIKKAKSPKLVVISSRLGSISNMMHSDYQNGSFSYAYRVSKAALNMLAVCIWQEFNIEGMSVIVIHPGMLKTRMGRPEADTEPGCAARNIYQWIIENWESQNGIMFVEPYKQELPW